MFFYRARSFAALYLVCVLMGAGCVREAALDQACEWVPRSDVERLVGIALGNVEQPNAGKDRHLCIYKDETGSTVLQISDDVLTVEQFIDILQNGLPTSERPDIQLLTTIGAPAALAHIRDLSSLLYVRVGKRGYLLTSAAQPPIADPKLMAVAQRLVERVK